MTYRPGTYLIVDQTGRIVRTTRTITSWATKIYQVQANGKIKPIN